MEIGHSTTRSSRIRRVARWLAIGVAVAAGLYLLAGIAFAVMFSMGGGF